MNIDTLIDELQKYCGLSDKDVNKEIYNSYQKNYLEGQAGVVINSMDNCYEIYLYVKNKDKIASPLAYMKTSIEKEANNYYTKLLNVLDEKKPAELIDFCREQK